MSASSGVGSEPWAFRAQGASAGSSAQGIGIGVGVGIASTSYRPRDVPPSAVPNAAEEGSASLPPRPNYDGGDYRSYRRERYDGSTYRSGRAGDRESPEPGQVPSPSHSYSDRPPSRSRDPRDPPLDRDRDRDWDRSRERDRDRDRYRPQDRSRGSSPDSAGDRDRDRGHRPTYSRAGPSACGGTSNMVQLSSSSRSAPSRIISGGAQGQNGGGQDKGKGRDGDAELGKAMQAFARKLQSTLEASSSHALAAEHHTRLSSFLPSAPPKSSTAGANLSSSLERAKKRVEDAESTLYDSTIALEGAFIDLLRSALSKSGHAPDISHGEVLALKGRVEELEKQERAAGGGVVTHDPPSGPSRGRKRPAGDVDVDMDAGDHGEGGVGEGESQPEKRVRLRTLIDGIRARLDMVTMSHREMDERYEDLQSQIWARDESRIDRVRLGIKKRDTPRQPGSWDELESRRDPTGELRGIEVAPGAGASNSAGADADGTPLAGEVEEGIHAPPGERKSQESEPVGEQVPADGEDGEQENKSQLELDENGRIVSTGPGEGAGDAAGKEVVEMLRAQVLELQGDIGRLVAERDAREKELVESVTERMKAETAAMVEASFGKALAALKSGSAEPPAPPAPPAHTSSTTPRAPASPLPQPVQGTNGWTGSSSEPISAATAQMARRISHNAPSGHLASPVQFPRQAASGSPNLPTNANMGSFRPTNAASASNLPMAQQNQHGVGLSTPQWIAQHSNQSYPTANANQASSFGIASNFIPVDQSGFTNGAMGDTSQPQLASSYHSYASSTQSQAQPLANIHPTLLAKWTTFSPEQQRMILSMDLPAQDKMVQVAQGLRMKAFQEAQAQPGVQPKPYFNLDVAILYALQHAMSGPSQ